MRRDFEMKADAGYWKLPVAIISHGNTVKNTEYSFLANVFAARGYLVGFIRTRLPDGSAGAFTSDELARLNAHKQSQATFAPY